MWLFYFCALIPIAIGAFLLFKDKQVVWWEWLISAAVAFLLAAIIHGFAVWGMTSDIETWSGRVTKVSHYPQWIEEYRQEHSETYYTGTGKNRTSHTRTWYTTEHETHYEHWVATRDFGSYDDTINIEHPEFVEIGYKFGNRLFDDGNQSTSHWGGKFDGGDRNIYSIKDVTGYIEPATTTKSFENRIKAAPSVFSFSKVPTNITVYSWPNNPDWRRSERLCGTASVLIDRYKWDCLNTALGATKKVNLVMVGFGIKDSSYGHWQQAKWIGGKKNDLVITFGGATHSNPAQWVYVFGWTESELVKKNLESLLMEYPMNDNIIPLIAKEVSQNYIKKDWHKFDYITLDPPAWSYWVYFITMILTQGGLYWYFHTNEFDKDNDTTFGRVNSYMRYGR